MSPCVRELLAHGLTGSLAHSLLHRRPNGAGAFLQSRLAVAGRAVHRILVEARLHLGAEDAHGLERVSFEVATIEGAEA